MKFLPPLLLTLLCALAGCSHQATETPAPPIAAPIHHIAAPAPSPTSAQPVAVVYATTTPPPWAHPIYVDPKGAQLARESARARRQSAEIAQENPNGASSVPNYEDTAEADRAQSAQTVPSQDAPSYRRDYSDSSSVSSYRPSYRPREAAPTGGCSGGATAVCGDGSLSYSASRRGTCSHHGGVAQWCG